jgi:hypothetical protein
MHFVGSTKLISWFTSRKGGSSSGIPLTRSVIFSIHSSRRRGMSLSVRTTCCDAIRRRSLRFWSHSAWDFVRATLGQPTDGSASRSGRGDAAQLTACLGLIGDSNPLPTHRPSLGDCLSEEIQSYIREVARELQEESHTCQRKSKEKEVEISD